MKYIKEVNGKYIPNDAFVLEFVLKHLVNEIKDAIATRDVLSIEQLLVYARGIERMKKVIMNDYDGHITGDTSPHVKTPEDETYLDIDVKHAHVQIMYNRRAILDAMREMNEYVVKGDDMLFNTISKVIDMEEKFIDKKETADSDRKAVNNLLDSLGKSDSNEPWKDEPPGPLDEPLF